VKARDIPNLLCIMRMVLTIPVVWAILDGSYLVALVLFLVAGLTDGLDGFLAKRFSWQSRLGGLLDPAADKLLLVASFVTLWMVGYVPGWLLVAVVARDLTIVIGAGVYQWRVGDFVAEPSIISKLNSLAAAALRVDDPVVARVRAARPGNDGRARLDRAGHDRRERIRLHHPLDGPRAHRGGVMRQLPLAVRLRDFAVFETFEPGPNGAVVAVLAAPAAAGPAVWLWGPEGSGKSHLLQAACAAEPSAAYLPVAELLAAGPGVLEGWHDRALVCIDDIDRLAGQRDWELAAFALFNRLWEQGGCLVVSACAGPAATRFALPDLGVAPRLGRRVPSRAAE
jgi:CDP-diacylglycerol--glycerol-3-phosphate 3-phosphatidyltransferase